MGRLAEQLRSRLRVAGAHLLLSLLQQSFDLAGGEQTRRPGVTGITAVDRYGPLDGSPGEALELAFPRVCAQRRQERRSGFGGQVVVIVVDIRFDSFRRGLLTRAQQ